MVALGRESHWLCCLCFARRGPHAAFLYTVHTLATVVVPPFFSLFYCIQFVCCSCTFLSSPVALSLPPSASTFPPHLSILSLLSLSPSLFPFLAWCSCIVGTVNCPFCRTRERKRGKWGRSEIMVFTTWLTARASNGASLETQHYSLSSTVLPECIVLHILLLL